MSAKCYDCKHRGGIPGDAHSCCRHPKTGITDGSDLIMNLATLFSGSALAAGKEMGIRINPHGLQNGWAMWPANYDPIWITNCDVFEAKTPKGT